MAITQNTNLLTTSKITRECLLQLTSNLVLGRSVDWSYSSEIGKKTAQIGDRLSIRRPILTAIRTNSMTWSGNAPTEAVSTLIVDHIVGADLNFSDADLALRIEDFMVRFIKQTIVSMANKIDSDIYAIVMDSVSNTVGQYNTPITSDTILAARELMYAQNCPDDGEVYGILTPKQQRSLANAQITLFNAQKEISEIYKKGVIGHFAGVEFSWSNSSKTHKDAAMAGNPTVSATNSTTLVTAGWVETSTLSVAGLTVGTDVNVGDVFSISGNYIVNTLTKAVTPYLVQYVVKEAVASALSAAQAIVVSPAIIVSGDYMNTSVTLTGAVPLIKYSTSGTQGQEGLIFHRKAIAMASPELYMPNNKDLGESITDESGVSIRMIRSFDPIEARYICRLDSIFAAKVLRPEWCVRIR